MRTVRWKYWAPVVIWILLIFVGSGNGLSAEHTSRFLVPFLMWLMPDISIEKLLLVHIAIRKMGHLAEYAIFAILLARAVFRGTDLKWKRSRLWAGIWIACVLLASADEFRQTFAESRGPSPWDVMIDGAGAICGLVMYWWWQRRTARFGHRI